MGDCHVLAQMLVKPELGSALGTKIRLPDEVLGSVHLCSVGRTKSLTTNTARVGSGWMSRVLMFFQPGLAVECLGTKLALVRLDVNVKSTMYHELVLGAKALGTDAADKWIGGFQDLTSMVTGHMTLQVVGVVVYFFAVGTDVPKAPEGIAIRLDCVIADQVDQKVGLVIVGLVTFAAHEGHSVVYWGRFNLTHSLDLFGSNYHIYKLIVYLTSNQIFSYIYQITLKLAVCVGTLTIGTCILLFFFFLIFLFFIITFFLFRS